MKRQLILCFTICVFMSACATTRAAREAMTNAQGVIQDAETALAAAKNGGAETYAAALVRSAAKDLQNAKDEFGKKEYAKAVFYAQNSSGLGKSAVSETEIAKKREAEAKQKAEESRRKAALEEKAKAEAAAKAAQDKAAANKTAAKPVAPAVPQPAPPKKEEPKKKSWWPW